MDQKNKTDATSETILQFTKIAKGTYGSIFTDKKTVQKKSIYITPEIFGFFTRIPNVLSINNIIFADTNIIYEYDYHPNTFMDRVEIFPQDIADLIIALIRLKTLNLVHMDIKPNNIFYNNKGQIQLADLGGLYHLDTADYVEGGVGTYYSVSPENILHNKFYTNSQVWSIGILLYHRLVTDYSNLKTLIDIFDKNKPNTFQTIAPNAIEIFVREAKESKFNMNIMKNSNHSDLQDFILKCLTINRHIRPELEDLLKHPFLKDCNVKYNHSIYIFPHTIEQPIHNSVGIVTQIINIIKLKKIQYKVFSMIIHIVMTTPLTITEAMECAFSMYYKNSININKIKDIYNKIKVCGFMPGNSIYYSIESKEELYKFLKSLEISPGIYLTLIPKQKFYSPQYIDLQEYLKQ